MGNNTVAGKRKLKADLVTIFLLFIPAVAFTTIAVPTIAKETGLDVANSEQRFWVFFLSGVVAILGFSLLLYLLGRRKLVTPLQQSTSGVSIILAIGALMVLTPTVLYQQVPIQLGYNFFLLDDPNSQSMYTWAGVGFLLVALLVIFMMNLIVRQRLQAPFNAGRFGKIIGYSLLVIVFFALMSPGAAFFIALMPLGAIGGVLGWGSRSGLDIAIITFLLASLVFLAVTIYKIPLTPSRVKNLTALSLAIWLAFSLALSIQILWVIFMWIVVSLWPVTTISPSGK